MRRCAQIPCALAVWLLATAAVLADDKNSSAPAVADRSAGDIQPGITIFGEKDSPIGLFITPWKNAYADRQLSRPTLHLDEAAQPLDPDTFRRQLAYGRTVAGYARAAAAGTPAAPH
jgi:hypothetical protein